MIISFSFAENKLSQFSCLVQGKVDAAVGVDAAQVAQEEAGEDTGQQGGQQRAFADAFDGAEAGQGDDGGDDDEADIVADFDLAKVDVELMRERVDSAFAGEHEHVGDTLTGDAQCDQGCADDAESDFQRIGLRYDGKQGHEKVDAETKDNRHGNLQPKDGGEIAPEHQELKDDEEHVDGKCRLAEGKRRNQAQDIRHARNRRSAEQTLDNKSNAGRLNHDRDNQQHIAFWRRHTNPPLVMIRYFRSVISVLVYYAELRKEKPDG